MAVVKINFGDLCEQGVKLKDWLVKYTPDGKVKHGRKALSEVGRILSQPEVAAFDGSYDGSTFESLNERYELLQADSRDIGRKCSSSKKANVFDFSCAEFLLEVRTFSEVATVKMKRRSGTAGMIQRHAMLSQDASAQSDQSITSLNRCSATAKQSGGGVRSSATQDPRAPTNSFSSCSNTMVINIQSDMRDVATVFKMGMDGLRAQEKAAALPASVPFDETASVVSSVDNYYDANEETESDESI